MGLLIVVWESFIKLSVREYSLRHSGFFNIISETSEYMPSTVLMDDEDSKADQTNTQTSSEETTEPILIEVRDNGN